MAVPATPPKETVGRETKLVPFIVTTVPPPVGPLVGETFRTIGLGLYVYAFVFWAVWVSGFVTVTVTIPDACEVVVPVIAVGVTDPTVRAEPPKLTVAPARK